MSYVVVRHSQVWGTQAFPADTCENAITLLGRLAQEGENDRQKDGIQRYFCLAALDATVETVTLPSHTLVTYIQGGCLQWAGADTPCLCLLVLDGDTPTEIHMATCREMPIQPISTLAAGLQQTVADYLARLQRQAGGFTAEMSGDTEEEDPEGTPCLAS